VHTTHIFPYAIYLDYVTLETKLAVAQQTIVGYWIQNNNAIRLTGKAGLPYATDLDYVTLETRLIVVRQTIVGSSLYKLGHVYDA
jgi:hypothetical protein